jgi:predicted DNA-binding protein
MIDRTKKRTKRAPSEDRDSEAGHLQTAVRLPQATVQRVDDLAKKMSQPGLNVSRSEALRVALHRGLDALEAEKHP